MHQNTVHISIFAAQLESKNPDLWMDTKLK